MSKHLQLRIANKIQETGDTTTLILEPLGGKVTYRAGQFLTFIFDGLGATQIRRSYSISSAPGMGEPLSVTVKKVPNGVVSRFLVDRARPGDVLEALPPAGAFTIEAQNEYPRDIFLIGGGSGITPLFSLLKFLLHQEPQSRITLIDTNRNEYHMLFRDQLVGLARRFPRQLRLLAFLSDPAGDLHRLRPQIDPIELRRGRLSNALIEDLVARNRKYPAERARFFLCGPPGLLIKAESTLRFMGYTDEQVNRELFTVKTPPRPAPARFPHSQVRLHINGEQYRFPVLPGRHILEAARLAGIELPYSCLSGICTTCSAWCRQGEVEMYTQEGRLDTQATRGLVLTCVGYPRTPVVELELKGA